MMIIVMDIEIRDDGQNWLWWLWCSIGIQQSTRESFNFRTDVRYVMTLLTRRMQIASLKLMTLTKITNNMCVKFGGKHQKHALMAIITVGCHSKWNQRGCKNLLTWKPKSLRSSCSRDYWAGTVRAIATLKGSSQWRCRSFQPGRICQPHKQPEKNLYMSRWESRDVYQ